MLNLLGVKESFSIKTEILNLEFEVKSFIDIQLQPVLVVKDGCHVLARILLSKPEYESLKEAFTRKSKPEWNFFDTVLDKVNKSLQEAKFRRIIQ